MDMASRRDILRRLTRDGWALHRHGANHDIYRHPDKRGSITLPRHRQISTGVYRSIKQVAGWRD